MKGEMREMILGFIGVMGMVATGVAEPEISNSLAGYHLIMKSPHAAADRQPYVTQGRVYSYTKRDIPEKAVALDNPARVVLNDPAMVRVCIEGLRSEAKYKLRCTFLSQIPAREMNVEVNGKLLLAKFMLPQNQIVTRCVDLPNDVAAAGSLDFVFRRLGGPNVVVSSVELWSSDPTPLPLILTVRGNLAGQAVGKVCDATGIPISQGEVVARLPGKSATVRTKTDATGSFSLTIPDYWKPGSRDWASRAPEQSCVDVGLIGGSGKATTAVPLCGIFDDFPMPRLTPRPTWVAEVASPTQSLNGTWQFNPNPPSKFPGKEINPGSWRPIQVPGEWMMQGFHVLPRHAAGYRLKLPIPMDWEGQPVKIRFDAVYSQAEVFLNGVYLGSHMGTFTPFELDASAAIKPGSENVLELAVTSESAQEDITAGYQMVYHQMGGIIRQVSIFTVPRINIASLHVNTTFDNNYRNALLHVLLNVANEDQTEVSNAVVRLKLREAGKDGKAVEITPESFNLPAIKAGQTLRQEFAIPVAAPQKWDAEHPNLYVLDCELELGGKRQEVTQKRFGFRQVEVRGHHVYVNGQPIRLRGVARQDSHPLYGRTVPAVDLRRELELIVWSNNNNTYTCAFSPDEEVLNLCDELGLYVMEEPSTCWVGIMGDYWRTHDPSDPALYPYFLRSALEMIQRSRSHSCVISWMPADESTFGPNFERVLKRMRKIDPSRPVHFAWAYSILDSPGADRFDLLSYHYPSPELLEEMAKLSRPILLDQSIHCYCQNRREQETDPGLRDDWGRIYLRFFEKVWHTPTIFGEQVFNFTDDVFMFPSGEVCGNGWWGLTDCWRRPKADLWHVKKAHTPVKIQDGPLPVPAAGEPIRVPVENRYDFTSLKDVRIEWALGGEKGLAVANVAPHTQGTILIRPQQTKLAGQVLSLTCYRKGMMVDAYKLPIGTTVAPEMPAPPKITGPVQFSQTPESFIVRGRGFEWSVNQRSGQINRVLVNGRAVLVGGPVLMLLPKTTEAYGCINKLLPVPFNPVCRDWRAQSVTASATDGVVRIAIEGSYAEVDGNYTIQIDGSGSAKIDYRFLWKGKEEMTPRQMGIVVYAARDCDTLAWKRRAQWSVYPPEHIGRPEGVAKAFRDPSLPDPRYRERPSWPWSLDQNALGTRDFRSTRRDIYWISLSDSSGSELMVRANGLQHSRAFVDGDRIGLLVACYSGVGQGTCGFEGHARDEQVLLKPGSVVEDTVRLEVTGR